MSFRDRLNCLNDDLQAWFDKYLPGCSFCLEDSFGFYFDENLICWSFMAVDQADRTFRQFFKETLHAPDYSTFVYSILHEYGHYITMEWLDNDDETAYRDDLKRIKRSNDFVSEDDRDMAYYNLPMEWAASEWAVEYMREHPDECDLLEWIVQQGLENAYSSPDVRDLLLSLVNEDFEE